MNAVCPKNSLEWFELLRADMSELDEVFLMVSTYAYKVSCICARIQNFVINKDMEKADIVVPTILSEADDIETDFQLRMSSDAASSRLDPGNLPLLAQWHLYRATRIKLQYSLLELFRHLAKLPNLLFNVDSMQQTNQKSVLIVRETAEEVLKTIPYAIGNLSSQQREVQTSRSRSWSDALRMLWPLRIIAFSPLAFPHQKELARRALRWIGYEMGVRAALTSF
jgi:hypothetical protein